MERRIIKNTTAYVGDTFERKDMVDILIEDGKIAAICPNLSADNAEQVDGSNFFVTPGFVNAHFHPSQQLNRALGVGLSHDDQMDLYHGTSKIKDSQDSCWLSYLAVLEGLKAGTTCFYSVGSNIDTQMDVYNRLGIRAACTLFPKDIAPDGKDLNVRAKIWKTDERLKKAEELHNNYHSELVRIHFGVTNVRYASDKLILGMVELADKYDVYFHMHAAESKEYVQKVQKRTGHSPIEHLYKIEALSRRVSLAHAVHITPFEIEYLADAHAHVVHCPRSNSYLGVGVCSVKDLLESGVNVALGTDAATNNNSNEVRGEAHAAFDKMADKYQDASVVDYKTLFRMLTINGARAMGLERDIGTIEPGKKADLVLWSKNDLPFIPGFNHIADLVFSDSCKAHTVYIGGKRVLYNYTATRVDEEKIKSCAREIIERYYNAVRLTLSQTPLNSVCKDAAGFM